jgi:uncharacterized protein YdeI (YjbR/CyaY-like superfamily)
LARPKAGARTAAGSVLEFRTPRDWEKWLDKNYENPDGVWLRIAKKASESQTVSYAEALDVALCYGWIDAQKRAESESSWLQRFIPRRSRSIWSKINREKALALIAAGKMKPAGLREVTRAQQDGRWEAAYDSPKTATVPAVLQNAERGKQVRHTVAAADGEKAGDQGSPHRELHPNAGEGRDAALVNRNVESRATHRSHEEGEGRTYRAQLHPR